MEAMMIMSSAFSALGAIQQANAQAAQYRAKAQADQYNATVARNNADVVNQETNAQEEQQRRKMAMLQGQAYAGAAQSGAGLDESSNKDVLAQNDLMGELDALTIRYSGENKAKGLVAQAQMDDYSAKQNLQNADNAETAGILNAGANLLSGATKYQYYKTTGKIA